MKVFTEIEYLLEERSRMSNHVRLLLKHNSTSESYFMYLQHRLQEQADLSRRLYAYPLHWINTVKYILSLREKKS